MQEKGIGNIYGGLTAEEKAVYLWNWRCELINKGMNPEDAAKQVIDFWNSNTPAEQKIKVIMLYLGEGNKQMCEIAEFFMNLWKKEFEENLKLKGVEDKKERMKYVGKK